MVTVIEDNQWADAARSFGAGLGGGFEESKKRRLNQQFIDQLKARPPSTVDEASRLFAEAQALGVDPKIIEQQIKLMGPIYQQRQKDQFFNEFLYGGGAPQPSPIVPQQQYAGMDFQGQPTQEQAPPIQQLQQQQQQQQQLPRQQPQGAFNPLARFTDEQLTVYAGHSNRNISEAAKAELLRRQESRKQETAGRKELREERKLETQIGYKDAEAFAKLEDSLTSRKRAVSLAEDAINSGDVSFFSWNNIAELTGIDALRDPKGSLFNFAVKENLISQLAKISARAGSNVFMEKQLLSAFPRMGQSKQANLAVIRALQSENEMSDSYIRNVNKLIQKDIEKFGYAKGDVYRRARKETQKDEEKILNRLFYEIKKINEDSEGLQSMQKRSRQKVDTGTPLTLQMLAVMKGREGSEEKAIKLAKKLGYRIPTKEELLEYEAAAVEDLRNRKDAKTIDREEISEEVISEPQAISSSNATTPFNSEQAAPGKPAYSGLDISELVTEREPQQIDKTFLESSLSQVGDITKAIPRGAIRSTLDLANMLGGGLRTAPSTEDLARLAAGEGNFAQQQDPTQQLLTAMGIGEPPETPAGRFSERFSSYLPYLGAQAMIGGGAGMAQSVLGSLIGAGSGQIAEELGFGPGVQAIAEVLGGISPASGKAFARRIPLRESEKVAGTGARNLGLSEKTVLATRSDRPKSSFLKKVAASGEKTRELMSGVKRELGNVFESLVERPDAQKVIPMEQLGKVSYTFKDILKKIPSEMEAKILPDLKKFLGFTVRENGNISIRADITGEDLINFYRAVNKHFKRGSKEFQAFNKVVPEVLDSISPQLASDFVTTNRLYGNFVKFGETLGSKVLDGILSAGEEGGLLIGAATGNIGLMQKTLGAIGGRKLAEFLVTNPRAQNKLIRSIEFIKAGKLPSAKTLIQSFSNDYTKTDPQAALYLYSLDLDDLVNSIEK